MIQYQFFYNLVMLGYVKEISFDTFEDEVICKFKGQIYAEQGAPTKEEAFAKTIEKAYEIIKTLKANSEQMAENFNHALVGYMG
jgi:hypothetical protein